MTSEVTSEVTTHKYNFELFLTEAVDFELKKFEIFQTVSASIKKVWKSKNFENLRKLRKLEKNAEQQ